MSRMRGAMPPLPQYAFMAWCSVKKSTGTALPLPLSYGPSYLESVFLTSCKVNKIMEIFKLACKKDQSCEPVCIMSTVIYYYYYYYLFLFRSARSIGLRQCLAIRGSCFSFLDPLDIW
jgi:hypothetical protein